MHTVPGKGIEAKGEMKGAKPTKPADLCTKSLVCLPKTAHKFGSEIFFLFQEQKHSVLKTTWMMLSFLTFSFINERSALSSFHQRPDIQTLP